MIIEERRGKDILEGGNKRIAFAINTEGFNDAGFAGIISRKFWPELANCGENPIGTVLSTKVEEVEYFALVCHSLHEGWKDQETTIKKAFDAIPGDEPVASIAIGTGLIGILSGADFNQIRKGMEKSTKRIILY